jgi:hypothetical protein
MALLKPSKLSDRFMYVFFDTECTQDLERHEGSFEHIPNRICAQQMCSKCETITDMIVDCEQCDKRVHVFWQDPVGKFLIISGSPDHSWIRYLLFRIILAAIMHSFF